MQPSAITIETTSSGSMPPTLSSLFYNKHKDLHRELVNCRFVLDLKENPNKEKYTGFLQRVKADLLIFEPALEKLQNINLKPFFRLASLQEDIKILDIENTQEDHPHSKEHQQHLTYLADYKPHALLAHAGVRYYGFLHGGQQRRERLEKEWGIPLKLYAFEKDPKQMVQDLTDVLNEYAKTLTDQQFKEIENELATALVFAGDTLLIDLRHLT